MVNADFALNPVTSEGSKAWVPYWTLYTNLLTSRTFSFSNTSQLYTLL